MGPSPRPLYVQMGLTREQAVAEVREAKQSGAVSAKEAISLIDLVSNLPELGEDVLQELSFAEPGQALKLFQLELQSSQPGRVTSLTLLFLAYCAPHHRVSLSQLSCQSTFLSAVQHILNKL